MFDGAMAKKWKSYHHRFRILYRRNVIEEKNLILGFDYGTAGFLWVAWNLINWTRHLHYNWWNSIPVDHAIFIGNSFINNQIIIDNCHLNESEFFHVYFLAFRYNLVSVIPYHVIEYPIYLWVDLLTTYSWNFIDVFVILISVALDTRFKQINHRILNTRNRSLSFNVNTKLWHDIRVHYYGLMELVEKVDNEISSLILMSTGHNLFTLCIIIFRALTR